MASRRNILLGTGAVVAVAAIGGAGYILTGKPEVALAETATPVEGALPPPAPGATFDVAKLMAPAGGVKDHPYGPAGAKVVLIEYLSPTCPHCARFLADVFPQIKTAYVDTGKIQFIPRPFIRNVLDAVVFMLAEAAGEEKYHDVVDTFFKTQGTWAVADKPDDAMFAIAQQFGFTRETYDAALTNQDLFNGLQAMQKQAVDEFQLQGTPTFYINGKILSGEIPFDQFKAEIDPLLA